MWLLLKESFNNLFTFSWDSMATSDILLFSIFAFALPLTFLVLLFKSNDRFSGG